MHAVTAALTINRIPSQRNIVTTQLANEPPAQKCKRSELPIFTNPPPYTEEAIIAFLKEHGLCFKPTGNPTYDVGLFQAVIYHRFFELIESGRLHPGDTEYRATALYHLKMSARLLDSLEEALANACREYDEFVKSHAVPVPSNRQEEARTILNRLIDEFHTIDSEMTAAIESPDRLRLTREKACYLQHTYVILQDIATAIVGWIAKVTSQQLTYCPSVLGSLPSDEGALVRKFCVEKIERTACFLVDALSASERQFMEECTKTIVKVPGATRIALPIVSMSGAFGLAAELWAIAHNSTLMPVSSGKLISAHQNYHKTHLDALRHDHGHVALMYLNRLLKPHKSHPEIPVEKIHTPAICDEPGSLFSAIILGLLSPNCAYSNDVIRQDLLVLFAIHFENPNVFQERSRYKTFKECAQEFYNTFSAADVIPELRKLGFQIPLKRAEGGANDDDCIRAVVESMNTLWKNLKQRHLAELERSQVHLLYPKWFEE